MASRVSFAMVPREGEGSMASGREGTLPEAFVEFKNLVRVHLKQILKVDERIAKVPKHAVALLVMIAYEALGKFTAPGREERERSHWLFAKHHADLYGLDPWVSRSIFDAIRNGLVHIYGNYPVLVDDLGEIRLVLTWKDGGASHLKAVVGTPLDIRSFELKPFPRGSTEVPGFVCVDVGSLWKDLDGLFAKVEETLRLDPQEADRFERLAVENRNAYMARPKNKNFREWQDEISPAWRAMLSTRRWEIAE